MLTSNYITKSIEIDPTTIKTLHASADPSSAKMSLFAAAKTNPEPGRKAIVYFTHRDGEPPTFVVASYHRVRLLGQDRLDALEIHLGSDAEYALKSVGLYKLAALAATTQKCWDKTRTVARELGRLERTLRDLNAAAK